MRSAPKSSASTCAGHSTPATRTIRDAFDQPIVLVIRDQQLSEDDQLRAAGYFGKVADAPQARPA